MKFCQLREFERGNLTCEQRASLDSLIRDKIRSMTPDKIRITGKVEHEIVESTTPIKQRYYPVNSLRQKLLETELDKML